MLEKSVFGRSLQIFMTQPLEFALAGLVAVTATALSVGILSGPALGGIFAMALRRSQGEPVELADMLRGFERFTATIPIGIAVGSMILVGSFLLLVPGLILGASYCLALPACLDRDLGAAAAMAEARRLAGRDLLSIVILFTAAAALATAGMILMIAGLFVTVPLAVIALTLVYREVAGDLRESAGGSAP